MSHDETIIISHSVPPTPLEYADELARYIEHASCAVSVLGDLLVAVPEEDIGEGSSQSLGFLLQILGDGMMQKSNAARHVNNRMTKAATTPQSD